MTMVHRLVLRRVLDGLHPAFTKAFLPWIVRHPRYLRAVIRLARSFRSAERRRARHKAAGLKVPSVMILSVTSTCNLLCTGCYAAASRTALQNGTDSVSNNRSGLDREQWRSVITEARELGVFGFVIAGGEPFLCEGIVELCMEFDDVFFLIVTNGTSIQESDFRRLERASNIAIVVSLEGGLEATDSRRGIGVYAKAHKTLQRLWDIGVLTGISATITPQNFEYWMDSRNLDRLIKRGVRIGVFIEYIPAPQPSFSSRQSISPCADDGFMLKSEERERFREYVLDYRESRPIILLHSPNDEEYYGGCVSAGRGFIHVTPAGDVTACPVSNLATHNLQTASLREGLGSPLFAEIRKNGHILETHDLPCALLSHYEEVLTLARSVGAYNTETGETV
ncbi:MAG: radical SAM/SPASM domain-containing protein [Candidatus Hermodarchaeota archaeon]